MARKREEKTVEAVMDAEAEVQPACPTFILRADQPGHLWALMVAAQRLADAGFWAAAKAAFETLREFDLYEEAHR